MEQINSAENWSIFTGEHLGQPMITRFDASLTNDQVQSQYPYRIGIAIPLTNVQSNGLPTGDENQILQKVEDVLLKALHENAFGLLCAIISTNKMREFLLYCKKDDATKLIAQLKDGFSNYDFQSYSQLDKDWLGYKTLSGSAHSTPTT